MKKQTRSKKLQLHSETLKRLDRRELTAAGGGANVAQAPSPTEDLTCTYSVRGCTGGGGGYGN